VLVFSASSVHEAFHVSAVTGTEVWIHLRTGLWIVENKAAPHTGLFSQYSDSPWIAHSWAFDLIIAVVYKLVGLRAIPILLILYKAALAIVVFRLARGSPQNFWPAVLMTAVVQFVLWDVQLDPILNSILLLALELIILFRTRETGNLRQLTWMPALFVAWTNLDTRFIYGLAVLIMLLASMLAEAVCDRLKLAWFEEDRKRLPFVKTAGIVAGCFVATLISPYGYGVYGGASVLFGGSNLEGYLNELRPLSFRRPQDFVVLLLAMTAFFALGRRQLRDLFAVGLMIGIVISVSIRREAWLIVLISIGVIASLDLWQRNPASKTADVLDWNSRVMRFAILASVIVIAAVAIRIPGSGALLQRMSKTLPVKACDYIRDHKLPAPLFNNYEWGGFIAWYLPEYPVSIDGRNDLYGDDVNLRYFQIANGEAPMGSELHFAYAGTTIVPIDSPTAEGLSAGPRFTPVYRDDVALVLERTAILKGE
jgi:hypothetical protein